LLLDVPEILMLFFEPPVPQQEHCDPHRPFELLRTSVQSPPSRWSQEIGDQGRRSRKVPSLLWPQLLSDGLSLRTRSNLAS
jgi:hypothetical protein